MAELSTRKDPAGDPPSEKATSDAGATVGSSTSDDSADTGETDTSTTDTSTTDTSATDTSATDTSATDTREAEAPEPAAAEPGSGPTKADEPVTAGDEASGARSAAGTPLPATPKPSGSTAPEAPTGADPAGPDTPAVTSTDAEPVLAGKKRSPSRVLVGALSVLLVALLVGAGVLGWQRYEVGRMQQERTQALLTARDVAGNLTTITSDSFNGQIDALSKISTSSFKEQMSGYSAMFGALLKQGNVALRGKVTAAGLEKIEPDQGTASALVTVSTLITSGQQPQGVPQSFGLLVSLQRDGDRWLASNVEFLR